MGDATAKPQHREEGTVGIYKDSWCRRGKKERENRREREERGRGLTLSV